VVAVEELEVEVILELRLMVDLVVEVVVLDQDNLLHQVDVETHHQQVLLKEMMVEMEMEQNQALYQGAVVAVEVQVAQALLQLHHK
jgi:hypothetical protein